MTKWTFDDIPNQQGRVVIITGANSGLGLESARALAAKHATVILACRSIDKAEDARLLILEDQPSADVDLIQLDLGKRSSIESFVKTFKERYDRLDILMNNAGLMAIPQRQTDTGFEMQFGVNHIGHFILTGLLLDMLKQTPGSRVTTVSSGYHEQTSKIRYELVKPNPKYARWKAYSTSKLANVLFAYELNRQLKAAGIDTISNAAHPGYAATNLQTKGPQMEGSSIKNFLMKIANFLFAQSAENGALPQLYAATADSAEGGKYYGPSGFMRMRGHPEEQEATEFARDEQKAKELWKFSEKETGTIYQF